MMLANPWVLLGALLAFLSIIGGSFYEGTRYEKAVNSEKQLQATQAALAEFQRRTATISAAAQTSNATIGILNTTITNLSTDLHNAQMAHPLPAGCKPDAGRVHNLSAAIDAANAAVGH